MSEKKLDKTHAIKAGQLLSKWLRQIAEEETEFVKDDGDDRMATKAEAIARLIWKKALGYTEKKIDSKGVEVTENYPPDRGYIGVLLDRIEGRAPISTDMGKKQRSTADRVSSQGKLRIEKAGELKDAD